MVVESVDSAKTAERSEPLNREAAPVSEQFEAQTGCKLEIKRLP